MKVVAAVPHQTANRTLATVCLAAVVAVVVVAAVTVPTKRNSTDRGVSREEIFSRLSCLTFDEMIIVLFEQKAIMPFGIITQEKQVEVK